MPDVSVIIPSKNALAWLPTAIESIGISDDIEILIVDDGSTDGTSEFLIKKAKSDKRIKIIMGPSIGPSSARNAALDHVSSPLVAFLDADDRWHPGKIETQLIFHAKNPNVGFSFTDYIHRTPDGEDKGDCFAFWPNFRSLLGATRTPFIIHKEEAISHIYAENIVGTSTVVVRTDLLRKVGGFETSMRSAEDWDLWLRLAKEAPVGCVPWVAASYLIHRPGNVSMDTTRRAKAMRHFAECHRNTVSAISHQALLCCEARVLVAEAEAASSSGRGLFALSLRVRAWFLRPSIRGIRESLAEAAKILGYRERRRGKPHRTMSSSTTSL